MRAYFFGNMYLSSIQQGIQSGHVIAEMYNKYNVGTSDGKEFRATISEEWNHLTQWAMNHKVMILLNGGYGENLHSLREFFQLGCYPWASFNESEEALDGALTSVGIILPEKIYETARLFRGARSTNDGTLHPYQQIVKDNVLIVEPNNDWGIVTDKPLLWEYSNWEITLCSKMNEFRLAQ